MSNFVCGYSRFSPGSVFPPSLTVKEEPSPILDPSPQLFQSSDYEGDGVHEKSDITYLTHHPRPAAVRRLFSLAVDHTYYDV